MASSAWDGALQDAPRARDTRRVPEGARHDGTSVAPRSQRSSRRSLSLGHHHPRWECSSALISPFPPADRPIPPQPRPFPPALAQGNSSTKLEKAFDGQIPDGERYYGLENFGNTCYANSVLQALYFCKPFRERLIRYHDELPEGAEDNLLVSLGELFSSISAQKKRTGVYAPKRFIQRLKRDNELFRSFMHQDAHEFFNYTLNECCEILEKRERAANPDPPGERRQIKTWIHDIFQGQLTNQTKCLWCENVTSRDEAFLDLSLDVEQNSSVSSCLRAFSGNELLGASDKFQCDACGGLQEAHKRMLVKTAPATLALHLKRFKYVESLGRHSKLMHRVAFPDELKLNNLSEDAPEEERDASYHLFAVVVHVGSGPNHGHYVCLVRSYGQWLTCDDDDVSLTEEEELKKYFGNTQEGGGNTEHGYILFYQRREEGEDRGVGGGEGRGVA